MLHHYVTVLFFEQDANNQQKLDIIQRFLRQYNTSYKKINLANLSAIMEYNTTRNHLIMREYGRHIQKMVEYLLTIDDKEKRQKNAHAMIELMGFLNPHLKNVEDFRHKLWDHLFLIADFNLDVESPYPIPTKETLKSKPKPLRYPKRYPKFSHLGKNLEVVINKALKEENPEKKLGFANAVAYYMKLAYNNWHKEQVHDDAIQSELTSITHGQLEFTNTPYVKAYRANEGRDNRGGGGGNYGDYRGKRNQKFQQRSGGNSGGGERRDNRGGNGGGERRDNRSGGSNQNNGGKFNNRKRFN